MRRRPPLVILLSLLCAALAAAPAWSAVPIPPGPFDATVPQFIGEPVDDRPLAPLDVPTHPFMAPTGRNSMHNDSYATDAYRGGGPLGRQTQVSSATYGVSECATIAFDSRDRIVGLCGSLDGFELKLIDPETLDQQASMRTSTRDATSGENPATDLCGGAYFYLDHRDRAIVETNDGRILVVKVTRDGFELRRTYDVTPAIPEDDCLIALMPDWEGRIWFVTQGGGVGTVRPSDGRIRSLRLDGEEIVNSFAADETGGVYIVSDHALYRFDAGRGDRPVVTWRQRYDRGSRQKPGQLSQGSGTTPTLVGDDLVVITDNADPRMRVVAFKRGKRVDGPRKVCQVPVFAPERSATENSIVAVGRSVIVENNYGYESPASVMGGQSTEPGVARVGVGAGNCGPRWTSDVIAPTSVPKVSLRSGLLYVYAKPEGVEQDPFYFTAIDVRTGRTAWQRLTGTGSAYNNHYAAIYLGPDRAAYIATLAGLLRLEG